MSIEVKDANETLKPPARSVLFSVNPAGSFLLLTYHQYPDGTNGGPMRAGTKMTKIYLNDQGREVLRTEET